MDGPGLGERPVGLSRRARRRHLVLVGLMGSGKTTVGRRVAAVTGRPHLDSDPWVRHRARNGSRALAAADPIRLHALEWRHLREALASAYPAVVSAAASVADSPRTRHLLAPALVVWLRAPVDALAARPATADRPRPEDLGESIAAQAARRHPVYRALADHVVDTGSAAPAASAARVAGLLLREETAF